MLAAGAALLGIVAAVAVAGKGDTVLVSRASNGDVPDAESFQSSLSRDGRFAAFRSQADNLSGADGAGTDDIFVRDLRNGKTKLASLRSNGDAANSGSFSPEISGNGRFVVFNSEATNLSGDDDPAGLVGDVFLHDRQTGKTSLISRKSGGGVGGNGDSSASAVSADGRFVAFSSDATNLSGADDPVGAVTDVFLRDRKTGKTSLVSRRPGGGVGGNDDSGDDVSISANGEHIAFDSGATNFSGADEGGFDQIFIRDLAQAKTRLVSRSSSGELGEADSSDSSLSGSGLKVAFQSDAENLSGADGNLADDVFVRNLKSDRTKLASRRSNGGAVGNDQSLAPALTDDGRYVAFISRATNLSGADGADQDIHAYDLRRNTIHLITRGSNGDPADDSSRLPEISGSGRFVTFSSDADNLTGPGDSSLEDVFRYDFLGP